MKGTNNLRKYRGKYEDPELMLARARKLILKIRDLNVRRHHIVFMSLIPSPGSDVQALTSNFIFFFYSLTEVAGEDGPDLAPQKFLLSQKFRHLMRCKKYLEKNLNV